MSFGPLVERGLSWCGARNLVVASSWLGGWVPAAPCSLVPLVTAGSRTHLGLGHHQSQHVHQVALEAALAAVRVYVVGVSERLPEPVHVRDGLAARRRGGAGYADGADGVLEGGFLEEGDVGGVEHEGVAAGVV